MRLNKKCNYVDKIIKLAKVLLRSAFIHVAFKPEVFITIVDPSGFNNRKKLSWTFQPSLYCSNLIRICHMFNRFLLHKLHKCFKKMSTFSERKDSDEKKWCWDYKPILLKPSIFLKKWTPKSVGSKIVNPPPFR